MKLFVSCMITTVSDPGVLVGSGYGFRNKVVSGSGFKNLVGDPGWTLTFKIPLANFCSYLQYSINISIILNLMSKFYLVKIR